MIGEVISHYRIERELGSGGMGVVYRAQDTRLGRAVALKFLPAQLGRDAGALERFRREARAASGLNHPNICTVYDVGESAEGKPFLVMELLEGETLQARLRRGALPLAELLELGTQVAGALEAAHAKGIIHRDLKPANLFLTQGGQAKVLDFGLAKILPTHAAAVVSGEAPTVADAPQASELTQAGSAMGTVAYMSPEQARGAVVDARSDIFSLGVVLYEAATGKGAFPGATSAVIFDGILNRAPDLRAVTSPELAAVLQKALEKDPGLRYQTAADLRADLRRLKRDSESGHTAAAAAAGEKRKRHWPAIAALATAVAVLAAAGAWYFLRPAPMLGAKDTVVLADFANSTGDTMFNGALRQALASQLEQTPYFNLISDERMTATEKLMTLAPNTPIVGAVARQLCQRTGSAATIEGSITQIGTEYNLILNAVNCSTGDNLASVAQSASGKDQVLKALGEATNGLRSKLGESLTSMRRFNAPIEQVTTPSLEALQAYTLGRKALSAGNFSSAATLLQRALALDGNFAMAYATLGTVEMDSHPPATADAIANLTKAYALRDRVSQIERFYVTARYDDVVLGDELQSQRDYQIWEQTYPNDPLPYGNACVLDGNLGEDSQAMADCLAALQRAPDNILYIQNLAGGYAFLNRGAEVWALLDPALRRAPDSLSLHQNAYQDARTLHDRSRMAREMAWISDRPDPTGFVPYFNAYDAIEAGQMESFRHLMAQVQATNPSADKVAQAAFALTLANDDAFFGQSARAVEETQAALLISRDPASLDTAALTLATAGQPAMAESLLAELERQVSPGSFYRLINLPQDRAAIALARHQPDVAVSLLAPVEPYELGNLASGLPAYLRGLALLDLKQGRGAAAEFQKVVPLPIDSPLTALSELGLARAQQMAGDTAAARASYQTLLAQWKDADPELPVVKAARAEAAALR